MVAPAIASRKTAYSPTTMSGYASRVKRLNGQLQPEICPVNPHTQTVGSDRPRMVTRVANGFDPSDEACGSVEDGGDGDVRIDAAPMQCRYASGSVKCAIASTTTRAHLHPVAQQRFTREASFA